MSGSQDYEDSLAGLCSSIIHFPDVFEFHEVFVFHVASVFYIFRIEKNYHFAIFFCHVFLSNIVDCML